MTETQEARGRRLIRAEEARAARAGIAFGPLPEVCPQCCWAREWTTSDEEAHCGCDWSRYAGDERGAW